MQFVSKPQFDEDVILSRVPTCPRISIITPSYNQAEFIERTILSVLNQNYPNLELIIIDGGSSDGTVQIIKRYAKYTSFWVSEPDRGQADALNKGIAKATGEIIGWQNADDIYFPGALHSVADAFERHPGLALLSGNIASIDSEGSVLKVSKYVRPTFYSLAYEGFVLSSQACFWRRSVHQVEGYFDTSLDMAMDYDFWLRVLRYSQSSNLPQFLGAFRIHKNAKTSRSPEKARLEVSKIRAKYGFDERTFRFLLTRSGLRLLRLLEWSFRRSLRRRPSSH